VSVRGRLSALDGSFLRLESDSAHMHVGWTAVLAVPDEGSRPTVQALRDRVAGRLDDVGWCRWRLRPTPLGLAEPRWVDDAGFDLDAHVLALSEPDDPVSEEAFHAMRDALLSEPLDRSHALWRIFLIPRLEDGRAAILGKVHHALVDGIAVLQLVGLLVDEATDANSATARPWRPAAEPGALGFALGELRHTAADGLRALGATATAALHPRQTVPSMVRRAQRVLQSARVDVLARAPESALNRPIGPRRSLVGYRAPRDELRAARTASGGTLNDVGLAIVAGALRAIALRRGEATSSPLKAMVPVSVRQLRENGPGNRIAMVTIRLPVHLSSARERVEWVRGETARMKTSGRAEGTQMLYAAGGLLPAPLRGPVVSAMASPSVFNLTISQSPGPRRAVYVLGCEVEEVYSVVPIADRHALAIGMVRYRHDLFFGCYADPDAFPDVRELPAATAREREPAGI
jgi:WS/DGAT/MGAT family acyltransferase